MKHAQLVRLLRTRAHPIHHLSERIATKYTSWQHWQSWPIEAEAALMLELYEALKAADQEAPDTVEPRDVVGTLRLP